MPFVFEDARFVAQHQKQSSCAAVNESRHGGSLVRTHQLAHYHKMYHKIAEDIAHDAGHSEAFVAA